MLNYTDEQVKDIVTEILKEEVHVIPVGNHELKRHLVYVVESKGKIIGVFKLYYRKNRWNREVATLRFFQHRNIKAPTILNLGKLQDGTEWLFMSHIEGETLSKVKDEISEENLKEIYADIGKELGKIHSLETFDFFGDWDEYGNSIENIKNFSIYFEKRVGIIFKELFDQHLEEEQLHRKAGELLKTMLPILDEVKEAHLSNGDFGERNILVKKEAGLWKFSGLIDFEHCVPKDRDSEIINCYYSLLEENPNLAESFKNGYEQYMSFNPNLEKKRALYEIYSGLDICSWAKIQAPDYYWEGIKILKKYIRG
ncbi:aminoglycoside phosphotransferase [Clostridium punense]|uniref:Aminoglycoside phosphotransferase n=1 Tax=Clostridium punense TaxID=1054297 RepID=A0ABS4K1I2_9CLOT|nr:MULTISPECIES: aminoglycoside phosphotransferase family protein [Clostridium]EQB88021.1 hypothetical protein M918_06405 [Clostridium sp. BL8]MBP2021632.1 aminoglycoside phosphotransferase [Clostridium punense]